MKKHLRVALLILLVAVIAMTVLAACDELTNLKTPTGLSFDGDTLSWQEVNNAETYEVAIYRAGESKVLRTETVSEPTYTVYLEEQGNYEMCVRAVGDLEKYGYSDFSEKIAYTRGNNISKPVTTLNSESKLIQWDAVEGAGAYFISILKANGEIAYEGYLTETSFSLDNEKLSEPDAYSIRVKSVVAADVNNQRDSAFSDSKVYYNTKKLEATHFTSLTSSRVSWSRVEGSTTYLIKATKADDPEVVFSNTVTTTSSSPGMLVTALNIDVVGKYYLTVQVVGDGRIYLDSDVSERNEDYVLNKVPDYDIADKTSFELAPDRSTAILTWKVTEAEMKNFSAMIVEFTSVYTKVTVPSVKFQIFKDGDGNIVTVKEDNNDGEIKYTKVEEGGNVLYVFTYDINKSFYTYNEDTIAYNDDGSSAVISNTYMGHYYNVSIRGENESIKYLSTNAIQVPDVEFLSVTRPKSVSGENLEYIISKPSDLFYMSIAPHANYSLDIDSTDNASRRGIALDMSGYYWKAIDEFSGNFDGLDSVITNLTLQHNENGESSFIKTIADRARITNLYLMDIKFVEATEDENEKGIYNTKVAGVAMTNNGTLDVVYVSGTFTSKTANIAGIVYDNNGKISNAVNDIKITGRNYVAGIAINNNESASIVHSSNRVDITASGNAITDYAGAESSKAGGLVIKNSGSIESCFSLGNVSASYGDSIRVETTVVAGGLVAENDGTIIKSYAGRYFTRNAADIYEVHANIDRGIAGGFVGINNNIITDCYSTSKAFAGASVGGFVGENKGTITSCYSTGGTEKGVAINTGSFVGKSDSGSITKVFYYDPSTNHADAHGATYVSADDLLSDSTLDILNSKNFINITVDGNHIFRNIVITGMNADNYTIDLNYSADYSSKINLYFSSIGESGEKVITKITDANDGSSSCWVGDYDGDYTLRRVIYNSMVVLIRVHII